MDMSNYIKHFVLLDNISKRLMGVMLFKKHNNIKGMRLTLDEINYAK